jgi:hypothetical protein
MGDARSLPVEERDLHLQRIAAMLELPRGRDGYRDSDVLDVAQLALSGLVQQIDAA